MSGRARIRPPTCVVNMHTPMSSAISQTRAICSWSMSCIRRLEKPPDLKRPRRTGSSRRFASDLPLDHQLLDFGDGLCRIEAFRTGLGAVHDGMAAIEPERILESVETLARRFVARIADPTIGLQQRRRSEKTLAVPPVARAGGRAAGA